MAYNRKKIYKNALKIADEEGFLFVEHLVASLPITKETFYTWFPTGSCELDAIKEILERNKSSKKKSMLNKWFESEAPPLQIALYKLVGSDEERKVLSTNWNENNHSGGISIQVVTENPELDKKIENLGK